MRTNDTQFDEDFLNDAMDYWEDSFDEVVEEIQDYMKCDLELICKVLIINYINRAIV